MGKIIIIELGQLYGCNNQKEVLDTIYNLKAIGMSDDDINEILNRSKEGETKNETD